jgi:DNA invertase Pin-like site-specific DNA recombinase
MYGEDMAPRRKRADQALVVAYYRVSTSEQGDSGNGLDAQRARVRGEVDRHGWTLAGEYEDVASGKSTDKRPGLAEALARVRDGDAGTLMVSKLDRLSRSVFDFAGILAEFTRHRWNLVVIDLGMDLSTPTGRAMAGMAAVFAELEREQISARTRDALAVLKANGVRLGAAPEIDQRITERIIDLRGAGLSYAAIAAQLNAEAVPTVRAGSRWHGSTIRVVVERWNREAAHRSTLAAAI